VQVGLLFLADEIPDSRAFPRFRFRGGSSVGDTFSSSPWLRVHFDLLVVRGAARWRIGALGGELGMPDSVNGLEARSTGLLSFSSLWDFVRDKLRQRVITDTAIGPSVAVPTSGVAMLLLRSLAIVSAAFAPSSYRSFIKLSGASSSVRPVMFFEVSEPSG